MPWQDCQSKACPHCQLIGGADVSAIQDMTSRGNHSKKTACISTEASSPLLKTSLSYATLFGKKLSIIMSLITSLHSIDLSNGLELSHHQLHFSSNSIHYSYSMLNVIMGWTPWPCLLSFQTLGSCYQAAFAYCGSLTWTQFLENSFSLTFTILHKFLHHNTMILVDWPTPYDSWSYPQRPSHSSCCKYSHGS